MSIRPRWSIRSFLCHDVFQHRRPPRYASALLQRPPAVLCHHRYHKYSSITPPTVARHHADDRRAAVHSQARAKLDSNAVKQKEDDSAGNAAHLSDEGAQGDMSYVECYEHQLEELLPDPLRDRDRVRARKPLDPTELIAILSSAQSDQRGSINLLSRLVLVHNRVNAALFFVDQLLDGVVARKSHTAQLPPSSSAWSGCLGVEELKQPIELRKPQNHMVPLPHSLKDQYDNLPSSGASGLAEVWQFLGYLIVGASNTNSGTAAQVMSLVYQILAKLHHRGLVPDNIYDWANSPFSSTVQRSPILYLLSSRILSTLSDASWRSYQDEAISRGEQLGISYQKTQDPPGGRFRLKVRELGPEAWLEFILWCCVESDCPQAGANLVLLLAQQQSDPWLTSSWTSDADRESAIKIDWDRVDSRPGGVVGRFEGYSHDNPLAQLPSRTISVEVILAIIEGSIDAVTPSAGSCPSSTAALLVTIEQLLAFLRPHRPPHAYIEYISARLFGTVSPNVLEQPQALARFMEAVSTIRALSTSTSGTSAPAGMDFDTIVQQSQLYAGLLQVCMHVRGCLGEVQKAIEAYDQIQEMVDQSKVKAIASFLASPPDSAPPSISNKDFVMSHSQLPLLRIAAFLDILTENSASSLSEWLIYSTDVDGPLIQASAFQRTPIASALIRYAGANHDLQLLQYVMTAIRSRKVRPPVNILRLEANAYMQCLDFRSAAACLQALKSAIAGGVHPDNFACLAACILRLEAGSASKGRRRYLADAVALMGDMLRGQYDCDSGDFSIVQKRLFKQQIGHLLKMFEDLASAKLNLMASSFERKYPSSNAPTLLPRTFNTLLHGIVEVMGAAEGVRIWDQFCQPPSVGRYEAVLEHEPDSDSDNVSLPRDGSSDKSSLYTEHATMSTDDTLEALDPFHREVNSAASNILLTSTGFQDFVPASSTVQSETAFRDEALVGANKQRHSPVVVPSLRSLMIIVNRAISEASGTNSSSSATQAQRATSLLRSSWLKDRLRAFGVDDEYKDLLGAVGETSGLVTEWYPRSTTKHPPRQSVATEKPPAVSDLFSGVHGDRAGHATAVQQR